MKADIQAILKRFDLRDTQPRRLVLKALVRMKKPSSHKEIYEWIRKKDAAINLVTVYRILETFEETGIIHKHHSSGGFVLCTHTGESGHHVLLSCEDCGKVEECIDAEFCKHENRLAKKHHFIPKTHLSELGGVCSSCAT